MTSEAERLRELLAITRAITGTSDYDAALTLVVEKACGLARADGAVLLLAASGSPATIAAAVGLPPSARARRIVLDERLDATLRDELGLGAHAHVFSVPMLLRGDVRGALVTFKRNAVATAAPPATADDELLLSALADQAALLLGNMVHLRDLESALSALSAERSWLHAVIDHFPTALVLSAEHDGGRVEANARAEELFGHSIETDAGVLQHARQICRPDGTMLPLDDTPVARALAGHVVHQELAVRQPGGQLVPVLASAAPVRDPSSGVFGAVALYEDISALKALDRMREEWTSVVAHDLRQPLNAIAVHAQLLTRASPDQGDDVRASSAHILTSVHNLRQMIRDLLETSLLEAHRLRLARRACSVRVLLDDTVARSAAGDHPMAVHAPDGLPDVYADPVRVEQVLANLISNAVKYGEPGAPIHLGAKRQERHVEIYVRNRGAGLEAATIDSLFDRFERGRRRGPARDGLGLGLYITKGLVVAHGGSIWAESSPGETTTFHFTLPVFTPQSRAARSS